MELSRVIETFKIDNKYKFHEQLFSGHINETYLVTLDNNDKYIVQKMNNYVFKDPVALMDNIINVTTYIKEQYKKIGVDSKRYVLDFIESKDNKYYSIVDGNYYRMYHYIDNSDTYYSSDNLNILYEMGYAFGNFQKMLSSFDASTLHEIIPNFHNTIDRYNNLKKSIALDVKGRVAEVKDLIDEYMKYEELACKMTHMLQDGELPLRVTHNDTKCNNVLIENGTNKGIAVIDLDTIMPGLAGFDFGDSIRSGASMAKEDEIDASLIGCDVNKFEAYAKGFLKATKDTLTQNEKDTLVLGAFNMTIECGVRFLTDYLDGDKYFHVKFENQNN